MDGGVALHNLQFKWIMGIGRIGSSLKKMVRGDGEMGNYGQGEFKGREGIKIVGWEGWGKAPVNGESEGHYLKYGDGTSPRFIQRRNSVRIVRHLLSCGTL